ncbi:peptidoglycan-binding domain-containing protein [Streptomyces sp. CC219B]|uniref:peptidoglycan-binding domain-containing protein n=1 Tax=Streptomyces sp. CC219B TaxID=3044574 RepID=UPI0024A9354F|nr:peptidoglycan-binding domain-containing protein [Streptomyces sp. CC219B]
MKTRTARTKAGLVASAMMLAGMGTTLVTATPAAAASWCNSYNISSKGFIEWAGEAQIPVYKSSSTTTRNCQMSVGSNGSHVKALQKTLNKCYGRSLDVDGDFGSLTRSALIHAQKKAFPKDSSQWDGIYGPNTRDALLWYYKPVTPGYDECSML